MGKKFGSGREPCVQFP